MRFDSSPETYLITAPKGAQLCTMNLKEFYLSSWEETQDPNNVTDRTPVSFPQGRVTVSVSVIGEKTHLNLEGQGWFIYAETRQDGQVTATNWFSFRRAWRVVEGALVPGEHPQSIELIDGILYSYKGLYETSDETWVVADNRNEAASFLK